ncbi:FP25K [Plodia interpunctella granulovirus]|uniref:FP25K n=1 Tax=Plodia interpunctella granulovirus TaxID=262175 RepID=A0A1L5JH32_9BBAC|nr:FP25K [Plodia interpunctella granulovirus]APO13987.1 FP25K [Plodia interpunctella granulovirus]
MQRPQYDITDCVEIFGLGDWDDYNKCVEIIAKKLNLNYHDAEYSVEKGNGLLVKLCNSKAVNEWERKSREHRLTLGDIREGGGDGKIKIFAAAPTKFKLLLHHVRQLLPEFKYIWIGKKGVMARYKSRTQIHFIKNEDDIRYIKEFY